MTVLFADMKGSMEMIADRDPEEARRILDPVLQAMIDGVYQYEGIVTQIMGDGIMALFGAPIAYEDHAIRACHAALDIRRRVAQHSVLTRAQYGINSEIRVGLNSGEVVVRTLKNRFQTDYSAIGHAAHLAARLEQIAKPGTILISASTLRAASRLLDVVALAPVPIKGLDRPVPTFELIAARHVKAPVQAAATTAVQSPFSGRAFELKTLQELSVRAAEGHGQIASLVGDAGVGKSRLALEFQRSIESFGWFQVKTEAVSYETHTAYFSIAALLKSYFDLRNTDTANRMREKIIARIETLNRELRDTVSSFLSLLDVPIDDAEWNAIDPTAKRLLTIEALKRLLLSESRNRPLLILFEDLQWIDSESQTVLDALVELIPATRILILITCRGGYEHRWSGRNYYTKVIVDSLAPAAVEHILDGLLGSDATLMPLKQRLLEHTEGNPFFLEESVKSLIETGALVGADGQYILSKALVELEIPATVHAVLAARIDRVLPQDKALLQTAAVVGKDVPLLILERMIGQQWDLLSASLQRLQHSELLYERNIAPREYTFRHALTHDVVYAGLLREQRKDLHAAAVRALEEAYPDRIAENVETLARHALLGEVWEKAFQYLRHAASSTAARSEYAASARWLRSAIDVLSHLPDNDDFARLAIDARFELHTAIVASGGHAQVFEILAEAEELGRTLNDDARLARTLGYQAMGRWWIAEYADSIKIGSRALDAARRVNSPRMAAIALVAIGWSHHSRGDWAHADDAMTEVLDIARRNPTDFGIMLGLPLPQVLAHSWLARGHAERGDFAQARSHAGEAVRLSEAVDHPWSRAAASHAVGATLILERRVFEAIDALKSGRIICERYDIASWWTAIASLLGYAFALDGNPEGLPLLEEVLRRMALTGRLAEKSLRIAWLAEAFLLQSQIARAIELGHEAVELACMHQERPAEAQALFLLGNITLQTKPQEKDIALKLYGQALAAARVLSMRPLKRRCCDAIKRIS